MIVSAATHTIRMQINCINTPDKLIVLGLLCKCVQRTDCGEPQHAKWNRLSTTNETLLHFPAQTEEYEHVLSRDVHVYFGTTAGGCRLLSCVVLPVADFCLILRITTSNKITHQFLFIYLLIFRFFQSRWSFLCIPGFCLRYYQDNVVSLEEMHLWKNKRVHSYTAFYSKQSLKTIMLKSSSNPHRFSKPDQNLESRPKPLSEYGSKQSWYGNSWDPVNMEIYKVFCWGRLGFSCQRNENYLSYTVLKYLWPNSTMSCINTNPAHRHWDPKQNFHPRIFHVFPFRYAIDVWVYTK